MYTKIRTLHIAGAAVLAVMASTTAPGLLAESSAAPASKPALNLHTSLNLHASLMAPITPIASLSLTPAVGAASSDESTSSSSISAAPDALATERLSLSNSDSTQPPPRRRYGRPRYSDRTHNADGSNRLAFVIGGGLTEPSGATGRDLTLSYKFQAGVGYNFSKRFGVMAQFDYDHFGLPGSVIQAQAAKYAALQIKDPNTGNTISINGLDANSHIWSLTLNPIFNVIQGEKAGAYVVVGGGFYRKSVNFTLPQTGVYCDYYGYCYQVSSNQNFDTYSNGAGGVNGGVGFTYKPSRFANQKLFAEARYVWVANKASTTTEAQGNYYPQANNRTGYFPVTVGVRW